MGEIMSTSTITQKDLMDAHFDKRLRDFVHTSFPAVITRIVRAGVVDIQPLVSTRRPTGQIIPYPEIPEVRIQHISVNAGGVFISLPYKVGDKVWAIVSERDVASLMSLGTVDISTTVTHDLSDCFCIPSFVTDADGLETDPDNIVIANKSTKIVVREDGVYIDTQEYQLNASSATIDAPNTKVMGKVGFNGKEPVELPIVSGSRAGNAALALLLTQLQNYGLIIDTTTP